MTILNNTSDGLYPELIVLFRTVVFLGKVESDELIRVCMPGADLDGSERTRLRGTLSRWIELGLFTEIDGHIKLTEKFRFSKGESLDDFANKLPLYCRSLIFDKKNSLPLWGDSIGVAADFVRGITWLLAQDIYDFPTTWEDGAMTFSDKQLIGKKLIQNDTRWNNLRFWSRYLGFSTGDSKSFQIDPTLAIKDTLPFVFGKTKELSGREFLSSLSEFLPVLDNGVYRQEIESELNPQVWRRPSENHLSMSLSLALWRLHLNKTIQFGGKADTGSSFRLTGRNYRTWSGFESVIWNGSAN